MSTGFVFTDLPAEIRVMTYKLTLVAPNPVIVGTPLPATDTISAQLLRTCRTCHQEGLPILYGENVFSMNALQGAQIANLVRSFERFGKNADLIRHLQAHKHALDALKRMRSMRGLRCMLQQLCCSN
jgi:hypothetical protein